MNNIESPRTSRRLGLALITTPLLWLAAEVVSPQLQSSSAAQLSVVAAHPHRWYWYTVLLIAGTITLVPAAIGIARLTAQRAPRLAEAGAALVGFSGIVAVGDAMTQLVTWQMVQPGADRVQMAALLDRYDNSFAASLFFLPGGLALLAGTALLSTALWRSRVAPRWTAITLGLGLAANLIGFMATSIPVIAMGAALMTPPSLLLGRQLFRGSSNPAYPQSVPPRPPRADTCQPHSRLGWVDWSQQPITPLDPGKRSASRIRARQLRCPQPRAAPPYRNARSAGAPVRFRPTYTDSWPRSVPETAHKL